MGLKVCNSNVSISSKNKQASAVSFDSWVRFAIFDSRWVLDEVQDEI